MNESWPQTVVSALGRIAEGRHQEIDELRRLPEDIADAMHDCGVLRSWVPNELGGQDAELGEGLQVIEEVAYLDSAMGWITMIALTTSTLAGTMPLETAKEIFDHPRGVAAGSTAPTGKAKPVEGGVKLSGRWSWASGIYNSRWVGCGAMRLGGEQPQPVLAFVPVEDVKIVDTWYVSGMKGTGSTDYEIDEVFVPEARVLSLTDAGSGWSDRPLHRFSIFGMLALSVASVGIGLARRALDEFRQIASERTLLGSRQLLNTSPSVHVAYARAEARVMSAIALRNATVDQAWAEATAGEPTPDTRRRLRLAATNAAFSAAEAIDTLWEVAGASIVYESQLMQRLQRDIKVLTQHFRVAHRTWEMTGALALDQAFDGQL